MVGKLSFELYVNVIFLYSSHSYTHFLGFRLSVTKRGFDPMFKKSMTSPINTVSYLNDANIDTVIDENFEF